jgi:DNA repair protein RadC
MLMPHVSEIQVSYRPALKPSQMLKIENSSHAADYLRGIWNDSMERTESMYILCLNKANRILGHHLISSGGSNACLADPKIIFSIALRTVCSAFILAHNHPSGNLKPSEADIALSKKIREGGKILDIDFLDHLIMTSEGYRSMSDENDY